MPKVQYPAYFENGLLGMRCIEDIQNREAFIFVPYKMVISRAKIENHAVLGEIIEKCPQCFLQEQNSDSKTLILILGLLYEISLGKESYWYPYLR